MPNKDFRNTAIPGLPSAAAGIRSKLQGINQGRHMEPDKKNTSGVIPVKPVIKPVFDLRQKHDDWLHVRIPVSVKKDIRVLAEQNNVSQAELIISLVEAFKKCSQK